MRLINHTISIALISFGLLLTHSCSSEPPSPLPVAESFIRAIHDGDYDKAASLTLAVDSAPASYKSLIAMRYKEMGAKYQAQHGSIKSIACKRNNVADSEADVYLTIKYSDNTTANILVQLTKNGEDWKIK